MYYILKGHNFINEIQTITQVFYPNEKFINVEEISIIGVTVVSNLEKTHCESIVYNDGTIVASNRYCLEKDKEPKAIVKLSMFKALKEIINIDTPWGLLTGIRPSKLVHELWKKGLGKNEIFEYMSGEFLVSKDKIKLCLDVANAEKEVLNNNNYDISLYIGIPFCPSRCLYCSFTSFALDRHGSKVEAYLKALIKEMTHVANYVNNKKLETIYIGGGTPTALSAVQLEYLLGAIAMKFDISKLKEYTVEAGRPDTITWEKLLILKRYGVSRISINPQTMSNETLQVIGRSHSVEQFLKAYDLARNAGHENINIDIILGLPGENPDNVRYTMSGLYKLCPENVTVHTLSVKRASRLKENLTYYGWEQSVSGQNKNDIVKIMEEMFAVVNYWVDIMDMKPYYMYRQKNMIGNFENVGYCKDGYMGIYNVQIMEERQSIIALGAGAVTKLVNLETGKIERIFNVKDLDEYITRIDEMIKRKNLQGE